MDKLIKEIVLKKAKDAKKLENEVVDIIRLEALIKKFETKSDNLSDREYKKRLQRILQLSNRYLSIEELSEIFLNNWIFVYIF